MKLARLLAIGAAAGLAGTVSHSLVMAVAKGLGVLGEPPPQKMTRRLLWPFGIRRSHPVRLAAATLAGHLGYGVALGIVYAFLPRTRRPVLTGGLYGAGVWAVSYGGWIPKLGLMARPSHDRPGRPTAMVLAHLAYGVTLAIARDRLAAASADPMFGERSHGGTVEHDAVDVET